MKTIYFKIVFILLTALITGLSTTSCSEKSDTNYSIEGKLDNLSVSNIYILEEVTNDSLVVDTIKVGKRGEFSFRGKVYEPTLLSLFIGEGTAPVHILVEPDYEVKIKGDALQSDLIEVRGGIANDDIYEFKVKNAGLLQSRRRILSKKENLDPAELKNVNLQLARSIGEYVEKNPAKIAGVMLMDEYSIGNVSAEQLAKDIGLLKGVAAHFYLTTDLRAYHDKIKISAVGAVAPDIELKNVKGKIIKLHDFRGKPVLVIFDVKNSLTGAEYLDTLKNSRKKLKDKIEFISIIIDEDDKKPDTETVEIANSLDWPVLLAGKKWNSKEVKWYNVTSVPYMILVSGEGLIQERGIMPDSLVASFDKPEM